MRSAAAKNRVAPMRPPAVKAEAVRMHYQQQFPTTVSGRASLVALDDADTRNVPVGTMLLTVWPTGYLVLVVLKVRDDMAGELDKNKKGEDTRELCQVIETQTLDGRRLSFAPEDLLRIRLRGEIGTW